MNVSVVNNLHQTNIALSTAGLISIILLAFGGNLIVFIAFYRSSNLQSVTNLFIVALAVTDILVASISIPIWLYFQLSGALPQTSSSAQENTLYQMWISLDILFSTASILNLCIISVDRFTAIVCPLKYFTIMTTKRAIKSLVLIWLFSGGIASLVIARWKFYATFLYVVAFVTPLVVMVYCYSRIFCTALKQARRIVPLRQTFYFRREIKATKTLAIVMGAFVICWGPFFTLNLLFNHIKLLQGQFSASVVTAIKWLHYGNSALNPIIYSCTNREFRKKIFNVLPCHTGSSERRTIAQSVVFWTSSFRSLLQNVGVHTNVHHRQNNKNNNVVPMVHEMFSG